ncbi:hypothetical protein [Hungatella sp.]|uniref:hypothetical protein n=1 Tax=Hungatella sp. TaxID=2613924 RepID=UPI002A8070B6|nr:hypothetical protein [Hungatella sp.]
MSNTTLLYTPLTAGILKAADHTYQACGQLKNLEKTLDAELLFCLKLKRTKNFLPDSFFWSGFRIGSWFTFRFLLMLTLSLILIWFCFEVTSYKYLVFYGTAACVIQHLVHSISRIFDLIFLLGDTMTSQFVQLFIAVKNSYLTVFTVFSMFMVYCVSLWTTMTETKTIGCSLFDCFCCLLLLVLQFGMFEWGNIQRQNEIMKQILHMECHDLKHQISALRYADSQSEYDKSIQELEDAIMIYDTFAKTGNDSLDIILAEKGLYPS